MSLTEQDPQKPKPFDAAKADAQAKAILSQGGSQSDVDAYLHQTYGLTPHDAPAPEGPGMISRGFSTAGRTLLNTLLHPQETAKNVARAVPGVASDVFTAAVSPGVGENRPDARLSKGGNASGRPIDTSPYDADHGGVTEQERTHAGLRAATSLAAPSVFRGVKSVAAPIIGKTLGTATALSASAAPVGAAANPSDPGAGAIAAGLSAPVMGAATAGIVKGIGKAFDLGGRMMRVRGAPELGEAAVARENTIRAVDETNYGQAAKEGEAAGGTTSPLRTALDHPRVQSYADRVRKSERGQGADDATVARETYKLMTKARKGLQDRMVRDGYDADADLEIDNLKVGMQKLKHATTQASVNPAVTKTVDTFENRPTVIPGRDYAAGPVSDKNLSEYTTPPADPTLKQALRDFPEPSVPAMEGPGGPGFQLRASNDQAVGPGKRVKTGQKEVEVSPAEPVGPAMPSFPGAVREHAIRERDMEMANQGADAAQRMMSDRVLPGRKQATQSTAAFLDRIRSMNEADARSTLTGVLGRAKEGTKIKAPNASSTSWLANLSRPVTKLNRVSPAIDALDQVMGRPKGAGQRMADPATTEQILQLLGIPAGTLTQPDR